MRAALFGHKEASDLALHLRSNQNRAGLGQRLHPRSDISHVAINLASRIEHRRTGFETNAGGQLRSAAAGVLAVEFGKRALDRQRRPCRTLCVVLMGQRIAEQREDAVAELFCDMATHLCDRGTSDIEIGADEVAPLLGIELRGNASRPDQVAEHHRQIAALPCHFGCG